MLGISKALSVTALALVLGGCAWVTAEPVSPNSSINGIRVYDVKPLLVVSGSQATIVMVPNYNRAYAVRFGTFLAKQDATIEIQNGMLSRIVSNQDSTALALALVQLIQKAVETGHTIASAFSDRSNSSDGGRFQVFDIQFDVSGNLIGLRPLVVDDALLRMPVTILPGNGLPQAPAPGAGNAGGAGGAVTPAPQAGGRGQGRVNPG